MLAVLHSRSALRLLLIAMLLATAVTTVVVRGTGALLIDTDTVGGESFSIGRAGAESGQAGSLSSAGEAPG